MESTNEKPGKVELTNQRQGNNQHEKEDAGFGIFVKLIIYKSTICSEAASHMIILEDVFNPW